MASRERLPERRWMPALHTQISGVPACCGPIRPPAEFQRISRLIARVAQLDAIRFQDLGQRSGPKKASVPASLWRARRAAVPTTRSANKGSDLS